jgi:nucleoid-associated protein YgaU
MEIRAHMRPGLKKESGRPHRSRQKAYRICSRRRFASFLLIVVAVVFSAGFLIAGKPVRAIETPTYTEVEIRAGDTLWQIAAEYKNDDTDIRRLLYDICRINDVRADKLQPGRTILIPVS